MSHIVPRFVWRWLKESSPTGYLRDSRVPNRRIRDGWKDRLLCGDCEQVLSADEKVFAEKIFRPFHQNQHGSYPYGEWALRFAVTVVWRALVLGGVARLSHLSNQQLVHAHRADRVWREFILGTRRHPGSHKVHLIPLDIIGTHTTSELSPFMNRYLLRAVDIDVVAGNRDVFVYAKLARLLIVGIVFADRAADWQGGKLGLTSGLIARSARYTVPGALLPYLNSRAELSASAIASLSDVQRQKLDSALIENLESVAHSEVYRAMRADVLQSGDEAFDVTASHVRPKGTHDPEQPGS